MQPRHRDAIVLCLVATDLVMLTGAAAAQVAASGATQTSVATGSGGAINVSIAPVGTSGISLNQYNTFSVPKAGVNLINRGVNANTIVNEVTSNNRSFLYGPLAVVGPQAHVIVANPSGITVDGGSFVNTGGVALATGPVSFANSATNPGMQDAVLGTGSGDILVTGAGLSGAMTGLQLIAGKIRIDGPVVNSSSDPNADINLVAGNAKVTLNSALLAGSTLKPWAATTKLGGSSGDILVDITPTGALSASRVSMVVGAQGAGVSFQGHGTASIGEFTIDAGGKVALLGAQIQAEKSIKISAPAIDVLNAGPQSAQVASVSGGVTLLANAGDINITGQVTGHQRNGSDPDSRGGVTLSASGNITLLSQNADQLAIVFASKDDLSVTASGNITNNTGRLLSNNRLFINAGGTLANTEDVVGTTNGGAPVTVKTGHRFWWWPWQGRIITTTTYTYGSLRIADQFAYISGGSVFITAGNVINSGNILAQAGALGIDTGLFEDFGIVTGGASFTRNCFFFCSTRGSSSAGAAIVNGSPAGLVASAGSLEINASTRIINAGGVILSNGNLALYSPSIAATGTFAPQTASFPGGIYNAFSGPATFLYFQPLGGLFQAPNGSIDVITSAPVEINGGALQAAAGVNNPVGVNTIAPAAPQGDLTKMQIGVFRGLW